MMIRQMSRQQWAWLDTDDEPSDAVVWSALEGKGAYGHKEGGYARSLKGAERELARVQDAHKEAAPRKGAEL